MIRLLCIFLIAAAGLFSACSEEPQQEAGEKKSAPSAAG